MNNHFSYYQLHALYIALFAVFAVFVYLNSLRHSTFNMRLS